MDESAKKFFEQLAGPGEEAAAEPAALPEFPAEAEPELVKSPASVLGKSKKEIKIKDESSDIFSEEEGKLNIDVFQTPAEIVIESAIAGVKPEDLDISITNESVTIRGKREKEHQITDEDYFYQECYWGRFSRSVILPQEVDAENATAALKNGVLTIRLPKLNRQKSKKLRVKLD